MKTDNQAQGQEQPIIKYFKFFHPNSRGIFDFSQQYPINDLAAYLQEGAYTRLDSDDSGRVELWDRGKSEGDRLCRYLAVAHVKSGERAYTLLFAIESPALLWVFLHDGPLSACQPFYDLLPSVLYKFHGVSL